MFYFMPLHRGLWTNLVWNDKIMTNTFILASKYVKKYIKPVCWSRAANDY